MFLISLPGGEILDAFRIMPRPEDV
jgi:hypothetical protein